MGYTISTPIKTSMAKDQMLNFLGRKMTQSFYKFLNGHWALPLILDACWPGSDNTQLELDNGSLYIKSGEDLAYGEGVCRLGYNYGPIPPFDREFRWALVSWIATKIGRRFSIGPNFPETVMTSQVTEHEHGPFKGLQHWPVIHWDSEVIPVIPLSELETRPHYGEPWIQYVVDLWGNRIGCRKPQWSVADLLYRIPIRDFISQLDADWRNENEVTTNWNQLNHNTVGINSGNPVMPIPYGLLPDDFHKGSFKRDCPFCSLGVFLVGRDQATFQIKDTDFCCLCGQQVKWTDAVAQWGPEVAGFGSTP